MKKVALALAAAFLLVASASTQVMNKTGFKNTVWTGLGSPLQGNFAFFGVMDTFQTRQDIGKFTVEGMLNVGLLANRDNEGDVDSFTLAITGKNPLLFHYGYSNNTVADSAKAKISTLDNKMYVTNVLMDSYYLNFLWRFAKNWEFAFGTKLNWQVGPAPNYGGWLWESTAHIRQGGFSTSYDDRAGGAESHKYNVFAAGNRPGTADVVGFVPFANRYAKTALGVRYRTSEVLKGFEIGAAIPIGGEVLGEADGFKLTDNPSTNIGIRIAPADWISFASVIEGAFEEAANIYVGLTLGINKFIIEAYSSADSVFTDEKDDFALATGASITFKVGKKNQFVLKPEVGYNFFQNTNFTPAWFTGVTFNWDISDVLHLGAWSSIAFGSKDKKWNDYKETENYDGGFIFDVRPIIGFKISKTLDLSGYVDIESRKAFDGKVRNCWSTGACLTYTI